MKRIAHPIKNIALAVLLSGLPVFAASSAFAHDKHSHEAPEIHDTQKDTAFWTRLLVLYESDVEALANLGDGGPDIPVLDTVKIGDVIALQLIFANMTLRPDQTANVSFDISITRPDGELYGGAAHKNVTALSQTVLDRTRIYNSGATLVIGFEPEDPLGVYEIEMTVRDKVSGHQVTLEEKLTLVE